ncbi:MAG: hypothetical protein HOM68_11735 [Gemmatimonadetes bacterium]|jgi:DNA polymerase IV|nr:hypothetical protein [Gemmatimonadota bacterium]MBT5143171.1 hypothetical protein [Gemmatimonadota bacterium]MBT5963588.1 hypothetical protein [Gemmatimonadota bacterium]MBT7457743.1 hypothetical protein [Gemmatimonadota bacterium]MBT7595174.1 hypothetical protein [Gemmatimonadota bacterium]
MSPRPSRPLPAPAWAVLEVEDFAAQSIAALQPALRDTAFAVIQQRGDHHKSAIYAVSQKAHDVGARAGMPVFVMRRKFGRRVSVLRRDAAAEAECWEALEKALTRWSPAVDLDLTRDLFTAVINLAGTPAARLWEGEQLGQQLLQHVQRRCHLQANVGVAASRLAARLVVREPSSGVGVCAAEEEIQLLRRMATEDLPGLRSSCRERAALYGLDYVDQLLQLDRTDLIRHFGRDDGLCLYGLVRGMEAAPRTDSARGISAAETILEEDLNDDVALRQALHLTVDKTCHTLRSTGQVAQALTLRLTYTDNRSRQKTALLPSSSNDYGTLCRLADRLFDTLHTRRVALKVFALRAGRTTPSTGQGDLFAGVTEQRSERLGEAITAIRQRMGFDAVGTARDRLPTG